MLNCLLIKLKFFFLRILYVFESDFILSCFKFLFNMHFCVVLQKLVQRYFRENLEAKSFLRKEFKGNLKISFSYKEYCDRLATISRPSTSCEMIFRQKLEKHKFHTEAITTISRLKASHESFCASVVFFKTNFTTA